MHGGVIGYVILSGRTHRDQEARVAWGTVIGRLEDSGEGDISVHTVLYLVI